VAFWLNIILSAALFNLPFFFPDSLGFLILFFWMPLIYPSIRPTSLSLTLKLRRIFFVALAQKEKLRRAPFVKLRGVLGANGGEDFIFGLDQTEREVFPPTSPLTQSDLRSKSYRRVTLGPELCRRIKGGAFAGFAWGLCVALFHFIWLYILLLTKSNASFFLATVLYLFIVLYFSFITIFFFSLTIVFSILLTKFWHASFIKFFAFASGLILYFLFLLNCSLFIFGSVEGYPFINPLIPLARYKLFAYLVCFLSTLLGWHESYNFKTNLPNDSKIFYIPCVTAKSREQRINPNYYSQKIYRHLCSLNLYEKSKQYKNLIVVASESTFPFSLNQHLDQVSFWSNALPENAWFLLGTIKEQGEKIYQSIAFVNRGLIIKFYDKKHLIPFTEKLRGKWKIFNWAQTLFLDEKQQFSKGKNLEKKSFEIGTDLCIIPQVCSEFFWLFGRKDCCFDGLNGDKVKIVFLFVNNGWFINYFRKIMENLVYLKTLKFGIPILYIANKNCFITEGNYECLYA